MQQIISKSLFIAVLIVPVVFLNGCEFLESDKAKELRLAHETITELNATIDQLKALNEDLKRQIVTADQLELEEDVKLLKSLLMPPPHN